MAKQLGSTEPRLWTRPLRELTPKTSLGFEVIDFALLILGITLYPWQQWLLIHALELLPDGQYRFRRVIVLVARQQGKTTLASVLAAWWLYIDSARHPDRVPPLKFKVVGVAQNLDIAREPWAVVKLWCDPKPETREEADLAIGALQDATAKISDTNGKEAIVARSRAHYEIRAAKNARGKPAARVLMDEMREQKDWTAWNAVSQTTKSFWGGMLIGLSNAGDMTAVVLRKQRDAAIADMLEWATYVEAGISSIEDYANGHDSSLALFEWSAPEGCNKDDVDGILQANPSIGYGSMTVQSALADIRGMTDAGYRTEVLCQWVTAKVEAFIDVKDWKTLHVPISKVRIPKGARTVWAVDTSIDRKMSWIAAAVITESGKPFVTVRLKRAGMVWVPEYMEKLAKDSGHKEVVVNARGTPSMEFVAPLKKAGLIVHELDGPLFAIATGRMKDKVRDSGLVVIEQPDVDLAVEGGVVVSYGENLAWSRGKSMPIDIGGLVAESEALYGLEILEPPEPEKTPPPPPKAAIVTRVDVSPADVNLARAQF
ncbi:MULTISPECIES: terminase [unclassified Cryobacterium]|uniref:terminase n=1 Tax=unclassified Cryobacterium TaxID=2649013 RepID=UPI001580332E|nr:MULTISPECIES: terminase [unclassified Cryobacterium]